MDFKVDYLTLTIVPKNKIENIIGFFDFIVSYIGLSEHLFDFIQSHGSKFYDIKFSYNNIYIDCPTSERSDKQGFKIDFSGQGIDFYIEYMKKNYPKFTVKNLLSSFFDLANNDYFKCKITRLDLAADDITYSYKDNYLLDMNLIRESLLNLEFVSPFHLRRKQKTMEVQFLDSGKASMEITGETIRLGSRKHTHIRFYDKIAEMKAHGKAFDENIKHWNRMEMQLMGDNAMSAAVRMITLSDDEFNKYFAEVVNDYIRFIDVTENNVTNYCRCSSKKWWSDFIGTIEKSNLVHKKPSKNLFLGAIEHLEKNGATSFALLECIGEEEYFYHIKKGAQEHYGKRHELLVDDYKNLDIYDNVDLKGMQRYSPYVKDSKEYLKFRREIKKACLHNTKERLNQAIEAGKYKEITLIS